MPCAVYTISTSEAVPCTFADKYCLKFQNSQLFIWEVLGNLFLSAFLLVYFRFALPFGKDLCCVFVMEFGKQGSVIKIKVDEMFEGTQQGFIPLIMPLFKI